MPAARIWTQDEIDHLRKSDGKVSSDRMALKFGCCRWTVLQKERELGIVRPPRKIHEVRPSRSKYQAASPFPRDDLPLPAGHPATWGLLLSLTPSLEGVAWPG